MTRAIHNWEMAAGATKRFEVPVTDGAGAAPDPVPTKAWFRIGLKENSTGDDILVEKSTTGASLSIVNVGGVYTIKVPILHADTKDLGGKRLYYEVALGDADDNEDVILAGRVTILHNITVSQTLT